MCVCVHICTKSVGYVVGRCCEGYMYIYYIYIYICMYNLLLAVAVRDISLLGELFFVCVCMCICTKSVEYVAGRCCEGYIATW